MKYLRRQIIEAWMFFIVPGAAVLLPWKFAWRWLRWWARRDGGPFDEAARAALAIAPKHLEIGDEKSFVARMRLIWLIDYCDLLLSITRWRRSWRPWHVQRVGNWPQKGPFIAAGFHHGTCYWVFKTLAEAGHDTTVVSVRWQRGDYKGYPLRYWHGRLRYWDMARLGRRPIAFRPGIKPILEQTLADGATIMGLVDLPARMVPRGQHPVRMLDLDLSLAEGVLAVARDAGAPIVPFWMEFDADLYTRRFCIGEPLHADDMGATLQTLADILDRQIRRVPEAWFFWPELPRWIEDAKALRDSAAPAGDAEVTPEQ